MTKQLSMRHCLIRWATAEEAVDEGSSSTDGDFVGIPEPPDFDKKDSVDREIP